MAQQITTRYRSSVIYGKTSFFAFKDAVDDWCDITDLEPEKRGPALRNRLEEEAAFYKRLLKRDPKHGVNYFKRFLQPHVIKGAQTVFLYRFMQLMKHNRGTMDLQRWMTGFQTTRYRHIESWMDLLPDLEITSPEASVHVAQCRQVHKQEPENLAGSVVATPGADPHINVPWTDDMAMATIVYICTTQRR